MTNSQDGGADRSDDIELQKIRLSAQLADDAAASAHDRALEVAAGAEMNAVRAHERAQQTAQQAADHALAQASLEATNELRRAKWEHERELNAAYHENVAEVAKGAIDRSRQGAEFVEKAALSIIAIYSALLALVFSVTDNPLPPRGVYAGVFLGIAIAGSAASLAFTVRPPKVTGYRPGRTARETQESRTFFFVRWVRSGVFSKRYFPRLAVMALMAGVLFLPAPFVGTASTAADQGVESASSEPAAPETREPDAQRDDEPQVSAGDPEDGPIGGSDQADNPPPSPDGPSDDNREERLWFRGFLAALAFCVISPAGLQRYERWKDDLSKQRTDRRLRADAEKVNGGIVVKQVELPGTTDAVVLLDPERRPNHIGRGHPFPNLVRLDAARSIVWQADFLVGETSPKFWRDVEFDGELRASTYNHVCVVDEATGRLRSSTITK